MSQQGITNEEANNIIEAYKDGSLDLDKIQQGGLKELKRSAHNPELYGLLMGTGGSFGDIIYIPGYKPFKQKEVKGKKIKNFGRSDIYSLHETSENIYAGLSHLDINKENFCGLKDNLERKLIDEYGSSSRINSITGNSKENLLIGGDNKTFTNYKGNQLVDPKILKDKKIENIEEIIPDPKKRNSFYMNVKKRDNSNNIVKYNSENEKLENILDLGGNTLYVSDTKVLENTKNEDPLFLHTAYPDKLAINKKPIKGTELNNGTYTSLETISQNGDELCCITGNTNNSLYEYKIDLNKNRVIEIQNPEISPFKPLEALQIIRNKDNHKWLMNEINKNN